MRKGAHLGSKAGDPQGKGGHSMEQQHSMGRDSNEARRHSAAM